MADYTPIEKLQPCLFDRLIDEAPEAKSESASARIMSLSRYREGVMRDLTWLLNSNGHREDEGLAEFPEVEKSVLNFGKRPIGGLLISNIEPADLEYDVMTAIRNFEPRVVPETLCVRAVKTDVATTTNVVAFEITGELWARPFPERLMVKTALDLETGHVQV